MSTQSYGTWVNHADGAVSAVEDTVRQAVTGGPSGWADRMVAAGKVDDIAADYRAAINVHLPVGVQLYGNDFVGPAPVPDYLRELIISDYLNDVDLFAIISRHDVDRGH